MSEEVTGNIFLEAQSKMQQTQAAETETRISNELAATMIGEGGSVGGIKLKSIDASHIALLSLADSPFVTGRKVKDSEVMLEIGKFVVLLHANTTTKRALHLVKHPDELDEMALEMLALFKAEDTAKFIEEVTAVVRDSTSTRVKPSPSYRPPGSKRGAPRGKAPAPRGT